MLRARAVERPGKILGGVRALDPQGEPGFVIPTRQTDDAFRC